MERHHAFLHAPIALPFPRPRLRLRATIRAATGNSSARLFQLGRASGPKKPR
jgi:hypothetical protein